MVPEFQLLGPSNSPYPGTVCLPQVPLPKDVKVKAGDKATIQVVELAQHGAALYSVCSFDIVLFFWVAGVLTRMPVRRHHLRGPGRREDRRGQRIQLLQQQRARLRGHVYHHGQGADPRRRPVGGERGRGGELLVPGPQSESELVDVGWVGAGCCWRAVGVCLREGLVDRVIE